EQFPMRADFRNAFSCRALLKYSAWSSASLVARAMQAAPASASHSQPVVRTTAGKVRGQTVNSVSIFKGIPYGAAPTGENRFTPPKRPALWAGVRDTLQFGPMAMQKPVTDKIYLQALRGLYPLLPYPMSEDCLLLNVWTPEIGKSSKRPIMVWLH